MKKKLFTGLITMGIACSMSISAFAFGWQQDAGGWWYGTNADNTEWYSNGWNWVDGNGDGIAESYYFKEDGYILTNTTTPDNYAVDGNGAWIVDGVVQTKELSEIQMGENAGTGTETNTDVNADGVTPSFKEAMDSYALFFEEYAAFMNQWENSNDVAGMLEDYSEYMKLYMDTMEKLNAVDTNTLTKADYAYYFDTMAKINKLLLEV